MFGSESPRNTLLLGLGSAMLAVAILLVIGRDQPLYIFAGVSAIVGLILHVVVGVIGAVRRKVRPRGKP